MMIIKKILFDSMLKRIGNTFKIKFSFDEFIR